MRLSEPERSEFLPALSWARIFAMTLALLDPNESTDQRFSLAIENQKGVHFCG